MRLISQAELGPSSLSLANNGFCILDISGIRKAMLNLSNLIKAVTDIYDCRIEATLEEVCVSPEERVKHVKNICLSLTVNFIPIKLQPLPKSWPLANVAYW